ncbi:MAG: hypothetical protein ACFFCQ_16605 [Promethearchaeota archaeon]
MNGRELLENYAKKNELTPIDLRLQLSCDGHGHTEYYILLEDQEPVTVERNGWLPPPSVILEYKNQNDLEFLETIDIHHPTTWSEDPFWIRNYLKSGETPPDW